MIREQRILAKHRHEHNKFHKLTYLNTDMIVQAGGILARRIWCFVHVIVSLLLYSKGGRFSCSTALVMLTASLQ
jgi:hypothetical protein